MAEYIERTKEIMLAMNAGARAIENTKRYHGAVYNKDVFSEDSQEIPYLQAAKVLREVSDAPAADVIQAPPWSPASEKPAEDLTDVLVYFEYYRYGSYNCMFRTFGISYTVHGEWSCFVNGQSGWRYLNILYWMPLPEPPKEV